MLINNVTYQRETLSERPIRQPLIAVNLWTTLGGTVPQTKIKPVCTLSQNYQYFFFFFFFFDHSEVNCLKNSKMALKC